MTLKRMLVLVAVAGPVRPRARNPGRSCCAM